MQPSFLGIDLGISVVKATLFSDADEEITAARLSPTSHPQPGWAEKDAEEIWRVTSEVVREVLAARPPKAPPIAGVGVCACGNGLIALDRAGRPVRPAIFSNDRRAAEITARWRCDWPEKFFSITRQAPYSGQTAPLLAWLRDHEHDTWRRIAHVLLHKDYIRYRLTGEIATDPSDLSATNLVSLEKNGADLLEALDLGEIAGAIPKILPSTSVAGCVSAAASAATGLPAGTPVATGAIDCEAALLGSGVHSPDLLSVVAGSWAINQGLVTSPPGPPVAQTIHSAMPGYFTAIEGSPTSTLNFSWFVDHLFADKSRHLRDDGKDPFVYFSALAERVRPAPHLPFFLPYLHGSPAGPGGSGSFHGLTPDTGPPELAHAVLEGVAFSHRWHLDRLKAAGLRFHSARLTGGATRSMFWLTLFADILDLPIEVPCGQEIGSRGAALCSGVAVGCWNDLVTAQRDVCRLTSRINPERTTRRTERYADFLRLLEAVVPTWSTGAPPLVHTTT